MAFIRVRDRFTGHEYDVDEGALNDEMHEHLVDYPENLTAYGREPKFRTELGTKSRRRNNNTEEA